jgi:hypothetical protein
MISWQQRWQNNRWQNPVTKTRGDTPRISTPFPRLFRTRQPPDAYAFPRGSYGPTAIFTLDLPSVLPRFYGGLSLGDLWPDVQDLDLCLIFGPRPFEVNSKLLHLYFPVPRTKQLDIRLHRIFESHFDSKILFVSI